MRRGRAESFLPLEVLGRRSLHCFLVHLPFVLLFSGLNLRSAPIFVQDLTAVSAIVVVYLLAKHHVLGRHFPS